MYHLVHITYSHNLPYEKVGKNEPVCIADEVPFEIPESWEWVRISSIGSIVRGSGIKRTETIEVGKPCVRYGELYTTYHTSFNQAVSFVSEDIFERCKHFSYGDILMPLTGENKPDIAKAVAYLGNDLIAAGGDLAYWTSHGMNPLYLTYLMASPYIVGRKVNLATGDIIVHISGDKLGTILIPIPPLSEQQRIVDKILEAEVKLAEYTEKENSLNVLQKNFPDALKKSILQWAVQGKLVPQDPNDEPASVLLEQIRAEKQKLIAEGKTKKDKHESIIFRRDNSHYEKLDGIERCIDDEIPFDIPNNWVWTRLRNIASVLGGKRIPAGRRLTTENTGYIYIRVSDMKDGWVSTENLQYVPEDIFPSISKYTINAEDIFITVAGTIGRVGKIPPEIDGANLTENADRLVFSILNQDWLILELQSSLVQLQIIEATTKVGQPKLAIARIENLLIALPPLTEQLHIVEKQRELFDKIAFIYR